jgi:murein tripeptide amidase MpaA
MGKYRVSSKGNNYEAMADLVRRHHLALPDIRSKSSRVAPTAFRPLADGPQIKTLERAGSDRPGIYFLGGIHAREWGSADILINFVQQLTNAYRSQQGIAVGPKKFTAGQIQNIVNHKTIYVFPQANPDGRNFSIRYFVALHSFSEDILYNWGDDVNEAIKPAMNFRNAEFDSKQGMANDTGTGNIFTLQIRRWRWR